MRVHSKTSTPKDRHLHVMATQSLIVLNKVVVPDEEEDDLLAVLEDGHVEGGTEEQGNQLIHRFDPNI